MNRLCLAAFAAVLGMTAGNARADFGGPYPQQQQQYSSEPNYAYEAECGYRDGLYGTHPFLRKLMFWRKDEVVAEPVRPLPPPNSGLPGSPGVGMPGTLVFPFNPYTRSPRDYFMYEPGARR